MRCDKVRKYIRVLRGLGADINATDRYGSTPLHIATRFGNEIAVKALLEYSEAQTSVSDGKGYTLLDWAMVDGRRNVAEVLRGRDAQHSSDDWKTRLKPLYTPWVDEEVDQERNAEEWSLTIYCG